MTIQAVVAVLLHRLCGKDDLNLGTPVANRGKEELAGLIGYFANTLVLRNDLSGNPPFLEFLARARHTVLDAYDHQEAPFEQVVDAHQPERDMGHSPLFQVLFDLRLADGGEGGFGGLTMETLPFKDEDISAKVDLSISLGELSEGLDGYLEYNTDLFDRSTIVRMGDYFTNLLVAVTETPDAPIGELSMIGTAERAFDVGRLERHRNLASRGQARPRNDFGGGRPRAQQDCRAHGGWSGR